MIPQLLLAQQVIHHHAHPVLQSIEKAEESGDISYDDAVLQKLYAAYSPHKLRSQFQLKSGKPSIIKCMVPLAAEMEARKGELQESTLIEAEQIQQQVKTDTGHTYESPSGRFRFHYELSGRDSVPSEQTLPEAIEAGVPDYIYKAGFAADSSYRYQVEQIGFTDFSDAGIYDVYFRNFGFYGTTTVSGSTTYITLHSSFNGFPGNSHPEGNQTGALYATIAHEIKHAIQYSANRWRGSAGSFNWIEMDATMMEEIVHTDVNDYYNYIKEDFDSFSPSSSSIFGTPQNPTPGAYYHVSWMLYFAEAYGMEFWKETWEVISKDPQIPFTEAVEEVLSGRQSTFAKDHLQNHLWHLASGERFSQSGFGFSEKEYYPDPFIRHTMAVVPDSFSTTGLRPLAASYFRVEPPGLTIGNPSVSVESSAPGTGVGVIGLFTDGTTKVQSGIREGGSGQTIQTNWNWNNLQELYIAVVNTSQSQSADFSVSVTSEIPQEDIIAQNYPNPFNPSTRIEFSISADKHVRLDVFDSIGRRIQTLVDRPLNSGFHRVDFDGSSLSSGVYFYRITTDEQTSTRKMTLIK